MVHHYGTIKMGGKTFIHGTVRLRRDAAESFGKSALALLKDIYVGHTAEIIPAYAEKVDFGDVDILMPACDRWDAQVVASRLGALEWVTEGETTSFRVPTPDGPFQLDVMQISPASYQFAKNYYAMNDAGNMIGVVARKMGFKLGHLGLFYPRKDFNGAIVDVPVSRDWSESLNFLGYDAAKHAQGVRGGFHTLQDVFDFVSSGRYFHPDLHLNTEQNARTRARTQRRPNHQSFLKWLDAQPASALPAFDWAPEELLKRQFYEQAKSTFGHFNKELHLAHARDMILLEEHERNRMFATKFSGTLVSQITGLEGPALGGAMRQLEQLLGGRDKLVNKVLDSDAEQIVDMVRTTLQSKSPGG